MKYIQSYHNYDQEMNEGLKNWVATFLMLANMGIVPAQIASASAKEKQEFVEQQPQDKIDAALFVKYMTDNKLSDITSAYTQFIKLNPNVKTSLDSIQKYVNRSGKQVLYGQKYVKHDYSNVDINKFTPDNWLTDMADAIPDQDEPIINNWISDYEKKTSGQNFFPQSLIGRHFFLDVFGETSEEGMKRQFFLWIQKAKRPKTYLNYQL